MVMIKDRPLATPQPNPETEQFIEAARQGKLLIGRCLDTGKAFYYPRSVSPFTLSGNVEWIEAAGRGTIYTFSYMPRAPEPFAIAYVELEEGPMVLTNIVDCDSDDLKIGLPVKLVFKSTEDGLPVAMFTPA